MPISLLLPAFTLAYDVAVTDANVSLNLKKNLVNSGYFVYFVLYLSTIHIYCSQVKCG
jgi:hypothetical protein